MIAIQRMSLSGVQLRDMGRHLGDEWAKEAKMIELRRLGRVLSGDELIAKLRSRESPKQIDLEHFVGVMNNGHNGGSGTGIYGIITDDATSWGDPDFRDFWDYVFGNDACEWEAIIDENEFAVGFLEGANQQLITRLDRRQKRI